MSNWNHWMYEEEGAWAYKQGVGIDLCPYPEDSVQANFWKQGWTRENYKGFPF